MGIEYTKTKCSLQRFTRTDVRSDHRFFNQAVCRTAHVRMDRHHIVICAQFKTVVWTIWEHYGMGLTPVRTCL
ncbi:Uncharacterised protein [Vibrio cholerae]|nr:Uncharacterised protein [Vibrio cholerae]CSB49218.1 Uncharacterised protein [Vibrio cholerae]